MPRTRAEERAGAEEEGLLGEVELCVNNLIFAYLNFLNFIINNILLVCKKMLPQRILSPQRTLSVPVTMLCRALGLSLGHREAGGASCPTAVTQGSPDNVARRAHGAERYRGRGFDPKKQGNSDPGYHMDEPGERCTE